MIENIYAASPAAICALMACGALFIAAAFGLIAMAGYLIIDRIVDRGIADRAANKLQARFDASGPEDRR